MIDDDERWSWHDQRGVTWAAGVAAVALIMLLVVAVFRVASGSPVLPDFGPSAPAQVTSDEVQTSRTTSYTTSYSRPSAQTTELNPGPVTASTDEPLPEDPATTSTSTTIADPYATTTTQNAGAV